MSDFSDAPFVAGSLFGLRAFEVDAVGRLFGPAYPSVFAPGENEAKCFRGEHLGPFSVTLAQLSGSPMPKLRERTYMGVDHKTGGVDCSCGFYAYFDGGNDFAQDDRVSAIIEGYGLCTVGTRGFRASKARLAALVLPPRRRIPTKRRERFKLLERNYPDVPIYKSVKAMVARHPVSEQIITPEDADFWTRPIR